MFLIFCNVLNGGTNPIKRDLAPSFFRWIDHKVVSNVEDFLWKCKRNTGKIKTGHKQRRKGIGKERKEKKEEEKRREKKRKEGINMMRYKTKKRKFTAAKRSCPVPM